METQPETPPDVTEKIKQAITCSGCGRLSLQFYRIDPCWHVVCKVCAVIEEHTGSCKKCNNGGLSADLQPNPPLMGVLAAVLPKKEWQHIQDDDHFHTAVALEAESLMRVKKQEEGLLPVDRFIPSIARLSGVIRMYNLYSFFLLLSLPTLLVVTVTAPDVAYIVVATLWGPFLFLYGLLYYWSFRRGVELERDCKKICNRQVLRASVWGGVWATPHIFRMRPILAETPRETVKLLGKNDASEKC